MDDASIDSLSREKLAVYVKKLIKATTGLKSERDQNILLLQEKNDELIATQSELESTKKTAIDASKDVRKALNDHQGTMEKEVTTLKAEIDIKTKEINSLKQDFVHKQKELDDYEQREIDLVHKAEKTLLHLKEDLHKQLDARHAEIEQHKAEIEQLRQADAAVIKTALEKDNEKISNLKSQLNNKDSEISQLTSKVEEMKVSITSAGKDNEKLVALQTTIDQNQNEIKSLNTTTDKMKKELNGKDSEINQLNSKLVEMRISMKAAGEDNEKIATLESTVTQIKAQLNNKDSEISQLTNKLNESQGQYEQYKSSQEKREKDEQSKLKKLQDNLNEEKSEMKKIESSLKTKLEDQNSEILSIKADRNQLNDKLSVTEKLQKDEESKLQKVQAQLDELIAKDKAAEAHHLEVVLAEADAAEKDTQKLHELQKNLDTSEAQKQELVEKAQALVQRLKDSEKEKEVLSIRAAEASRVDDLQNVIVKRSTEVESLNSQVLQLKSKLKKSEEEIKSLQATSEELVNIKEQLECTQIERNSLTTIAAESDDLRSQLQSSSRELNEAQELIKSLCDQQASEKEQSAAIYASLPVSFKVVLRCLHDENGWCLVEINRDGSDGSDGNSSLEWRTDTDVQRWIDERKAGRVDTWVDSPADNTNKNDTTNSNDSSSSSAAGGFAIESEDNPDENDTLPISIQDMLINDRDTAVTTLETTVTNLKAELDGAKSAFDTYRERARESLQRSSAQAKENAEKASSGVKTLETQVASLKSEIESIRKSKSDIKIAYDKSIKKSNELESDFEKNSDILRSERAVIVDLSNKNMELQEENNLLAERSDELTQALVIANRTVSAPSSPHSNNTLSTTTKTPSSSSDQQLVSDLNSQVEALTTQLRTRSDAARSLMEEKDKELQLLKRQLDNLSNINPLPPLASLATTTANNNNSNERKSSNNSRRNKVSGSEQGRQEYLSKAFKHFVSAHSQVERESLSRVMCTLLAFSEEDTVLVVQNAKELIKAPMGITSVKQLTQAPSLETIEKFSIEQFTPENLTKHVSSWFGVNIGGSSSSSSNNSDSNSTSNSK